MCFSLNTLNISLHSLACMISNEERDEIFIFTLLRNGGFSRCFSFPPQNWFFDFLQFEYNMPRCHFLLLGIFVYFLHLFSLMFSELSGSGLVSDIYLKNSQLFLFKIFLLFLCFFSRFSHYIYVIPFPKVFG